MLSEQVRKELASYLCEAPSSDPESSSDASEPSVLEELKAACAEMTNAIIQHEYYSSAYFSKEQPKLKELMRAMSKSHAVLLAELAQARPQGKSVTELEVAAKTLHRLVSATNKCSHKGYPEIVSYLTKEPTFYCSHNFAHLHLFNVQNLALALIEDCKRPERDRAAPQALCVRPASLSKKG